MIMRKKWGIFIAGLLASNMLYGQKVEVTTLGNSEGVVYDLKFSKSGSQLATTEENLVKVWSTEGKQLLQTLTGHEETVLAIDYASNGLLVSGSRDGHVIVWDAEAGVPKQRVLAHQGAVNAVAISPDEGLVATAGADGKLKVWSVQTGKEVAALPGHTADVTTVAFSKQGDYLISGAGDHLLKVWSMQDKTLYKTLEGHSDWVRSVAVSPDGVHLASSSDDKRVLVWKLEGREETGPVEEFRKLHKNWVTGVAYQDEGHYFVSTGHDNNLTISRTDSPEQAYYAKYQNPLINHAGHQYAWKVAFQPNSYRIAVATLGKGTLLTDYFEKIFNIPHTLRVTEIDNQRYNAQQYEFVAQKSRVRLKGEVSRPEMVRKMTLVHGEETIEITVKKNGRFSVFVDLEANGSELNFVISDKDGQINDSAHYIKINHH